MKESNGLSLLKQSDPEKPWFLQINFPGPHLPFNITEEMSQLYRDKKFALAQEYEHVKDNTVDHLKIRRNYAAMMENIDSLIAQIMDFLDQRHELENTIIIFASDHGEMLGERNHYGKCYPYNSSVNIPLIISGSGIKKNSKNDSPVELIDLAATILEAAGLLTSHDVLSSQYSRDMDAVSLWPILTGESESVRDYSVSSLSSPDHAAVDWRLVMDQKYKLIDWKNGKQELFFHEDKMEEQNQAQNLKERVVSMRKLLPPWFNTYSF